MAANDQSNVDRFLQENIGNIQLDIPSDFNNSVQVKNVTAACQKLKNILLRNMTTQY